MNYEAGSPEEYVQQDGFTLKDKIQYSLIGVIVLGGVVMIGRNWILKAGANSEQRKTFEEGSAATIAKQIKMAFENDGWFGTDKDTLRQAIRDIPSKSAFRKVMVSYQRLYSSSLLSDMQQELKSTEYNEMLYIISAKPENNGGDNTGQVTATQLEAWAKRLHTAFDISYGPFPGTDEEAIKAVFVEIPTQEIFHRVGQIYQTLFGSDIIAELQSELELWEYDAMMQIIYSKPKN